MIILAYIIIGIAGGILGGLGMGGGTLLIPLLATFTDMSQHAIQTANLIAFLPMSIVALFIHIKNKLVKFRYLLLVSLPAVASSIATSVFAQNVEGELIGRMFGIFLLLLGLIQLITIIVGILKKKRNKVIH